MQFNWIFYKCSVYIYIYIYIYIYDTVLIYSEFCDICRSYLLIRAGFSHF